VAWRDEPRVAAYLKLVGAGIRWRRARNDALDELSDHIETAIEAKLAEGEDTDRAVECSLLETGDPFEVGLSLSAVHRPAALSTPFLASAAACLGIVAFLWVTHLAHVRLGQAVSAHRELIARHLDTFLEDQRILSGISFFTPSVGQSDAGEFLNDLMPWCDAGGCEPPYEFMSSSKAALYPKEWLNAVPRKGVEWLTSNSNEFESLSNTQIDLSWLPKLERYDHWDIFGHGRLSDALRERPEKLDWLRLPLPRFSVLHFYARARLRSGLRDHDFPKALKEVRQLARLMETTETLVGGLSSVTLLNDERDAYEEAVRQGEIKASAWTPISSELTRRARRALYGYGQLFSAFSDPELMQHLAGSPDAVAGRCAALFEGLMAQSWLHSYYSERYPFEVDLTSGLQAIDRAAQAPNGCRLSYARRIWSHPEWAKAWINSEKSWLIDATTAHRLQIYWTRLLMTVFPNYPVLRDWSMFIWAKAWTSSMHVYDRSP
jgi:hypothetical protein